MSESHGGKDKKPTRVHKNEFDASYVHYYSEAERKRDLNRVKRLSSKNPIEVVFLGKGPHDFHLKLFQLDRLRALSLILPELDKLGIFVFDKMTFRLDLNNQSIWLTDFTFKLTYSEIEVEGLEDKFKDALMRIWKNDIENDRLNSLILSVNMSWQEVVILRAYSMYLQQLGTRYNRDTIDDTLIVNADLSSHLIAYFKDRFDPDHALNRNKKVALLSQQCDSILKRMDNIKSLDQDYIMRSFYSLINATVRTNYFNSVKENNFETLVLKFEMDKMPTLAPLGTMTETYVYSVRFEAIHRRSSLVARGGIRWSDRADFGAEILSLMRTQTVKNSVIIPTGAKGGFVLKKKGLVNEAFYKEGVDCYKKFIRALLSITDNKKNELIIHPSQMICYDGNDPYLVVAADKGTSNFSDYANDIAKEFDFWLDDAFASGGKAGYNHKVMGITAKGAWESVKRHFLDIDLNIYSDYFTVIGIGDMSGDVFGNGMLLSQNIKLIAAFDHRHIFIDPNPDPNTSWTERLRLYQSPGATWQDYQVTSLSEGGGVFSRQMKSIPLTPEIRAALAIDPHIGVMSPNELIQAILRAPVDLLWNGGIGTFVKASFEDHAQAADNTNILIRVNANELRCRVVGEGGNLGFTQAARIQYAHHGGRINTDFIDNVGGVDCSDREVNIKIALNHFAINNHLLFAERNELLHSMQENVAQLVLNDAHDQALSISLIEEHSKTHMDQYKDYLTYLEKDQGINREIFNLPDDEELIRKQSLKQPLLRPQIAIIIAHTKIIIKDYILKSTIPDDPFLMILLKDYFPKKMNEDCFYKSIHDHLLKREIIATTLANDLVNLMGVTYLYNIHKETGCSIVKVIEKYIIISYVFSLRKLQEFIEELDYKTPVKEQYEIFTRLQGLIYNSTHWFMSNEHESILEETAHRYRQGIEELYHLIPTLMGGETKTYMSRLIERLAKKGLAEETAIRLAVIRALYAGLNIIYVTTHQKYPIENAAKSYFFIGEHMDIVWFRDNLFVGNTGEYWDNLARSSLRNKFDKQQRLLTEIILQELPDQALDMSRVMESWSKKHQWVLERWKFIVTNIQAIKNPGLSMFFVAAGELAKVTKAMGKS